MDKKKLTSKQRLIKGLEIRKKNLNKKMNALIQDHVTKKRNLIDEIAMVEIQLKAISKIK